MENESENKIINISSSSSLGNSLIQNLNSLEYLAEWAKRAPNNHISDIILHFLLSFSSLNTKKSYLFDIKEFINFTSSENMNIEYINQIDEKTLIIWHDYLINKGNLTQKSIRRKLNSISSLLEFCKKRKLIAINPMIFIQKPKYKEESKTNAFTLDEVKLILYHCEKEYELLSQKNLNSKKCKSSLLHYTILVTLLSVGMRVNELCELKIKDIEFSSDFTRLHMTAKGNREHYPIIHNKTSQLIKKYIQELRTNAKEDDYLFIRVQNVRNNSKLTQPAIYKIVIEAAKKAGIEKKVSTHSCRATLATLLHNQGTPIGQIQALLNHKDITTTAIYIKKANEIEESAAMKLDLLHFPNPGFNK